MKIKNLFIVSVLCACTGALLYAYCNEWIIVRWPSMLTNAQSHDYPYTVQKKECLFFYWQNNAWKTEKVSLIWTDDVVHNCTYLLNSWLTFLDEERIMDRKVSLQTAIIHASGKELFLSFDRSPFNPHSTTFEKWMWIEGVLKTVRENGITVPLIHFLEHHQPLHDTHLDFTNPWPLEGFITS
jgi:hypothetical protein